MNSPGLRERKKQKTRWAIQEHALRLIAEQGYDATTVDQIAAAAEISPSTFFRYFRTKEDLIFQDEFDAALEEGLANLDPATPPMEAIRKVMGDAMAKMGPDDRRKMLERTKLVRSVPALRARSLESFTATVDLLASGLAHRTGRPIDGFEVRAFAGAVVGALTSVINVWVEGSGDELLAGDDNELAAMVDRVLVYVGDGLPL